MISTTVNDDGLKSGLAVSAVLHTLLLLFLYFGLPRLFTPLPEHHNPVPFEIVELADITNTRTEEPKPEIKQPEPPPKPPEQPKPQPPQQVQAPAPPEPAKPVEAEALKPAEKPKPPPEPKKVVQEDFTKLLKNLETKKTEMPKTETKADSKQQEQAATSQAPVLSNRLTITEEDALRRQVEGCWSPPIGARDAQNLVVEIEIDVNPDRTVSSAEIVDKSRYASNSFFRAAAEAARRAVLNPHCSPLELPADKYEQWKHIDFTFDPRDTL